MEKITVEMTIDEFKRYLRYKDSGEDYRSALQHKLNNLLLDNKDNKCFCEHVSFISKIISDVW